ncbi:ras GTPase-activating protein-binding protein 2-like [Cocos nucifera]|uniref:Ras GTPase-activating protein-binding protein 2-like n=1 Tax=Cocos nucifera TaxID=13894 RepID=A0A8K0I880_COCNU|nr:ras GTPase-activating protein-binding protein 2-like [Cocos nucifera]
MPHHRATQVGHQSICLKYGRSSPPSPPGVPAEKRKTPSPPKIADESIRSTEQAGALPLLISDDLRSPCGMALPTATLAPLPSPQVIGSAFVHQYYHILHQTPEQVYRFYQDSSVLSRPDSDGMMTSVTTLQAINDKIMSLNFKDCFTKIETVDSQMSYKNGVFIVVTGSLTGLDKMLPNGTSSDATEALLTAEPEPALVQEHHVVGLTTPQSEGTVDNDEEVFNPSENGGSEVEDEVAVDPPVHESQSDARPVSETTASVAQEDAPKKSYASIVKVMKGSPSPKPVYVPTTKTKPAPASPEKPAAASTVPVHAPETPIPNSKAVPEKNSHEVEGHSIYIRNLPLNATAEQVEDEFKKFGPIKPGGVQIERFCFGFVEFESLKSMQDAIEVWRPSASVPKVELFSIVNGVVTNGGSGNGGRGRFQSGRGGFRNDNFRGRGGFVGNMGYRRSEFRNRGEYTGQGRGQVARVGDVYQQRVFQNGNGRVGRPDGLKQTAVSA